MATGTLELELVSITLDDELYMRERVYEDKVSEYAELVEGGQVLPNPVVFGDEAGKLWLADGRLTFLAHQRLGRTTIAVEVRPGGKREALDFACRANTHGLPYTNHEKRRVAIMRLTDAEWSKDTDREISRITGLSHTFISNVRAELAVKATAGAGSDVGRTRQAKGRGKAARTVSQLGGNGKLGASEPPTSNESRDARLTAHGGLAMTAARQARSVPTLSAAANQCPPPHPEQESASKSSHPSPSDSAMTTSVPGEKANDSGLHDRADSAVPRASSGGNGCHPRGRLQPGHEATPAETPSMADCQSLPVPEQTPSVGDGSIDKSQTLDVPDHENVTSNEALPAALDEQQATVARTHAGENALKLLLTGWLGVVELGWTHIRSPVWGQIFDGVRASHEVPNIPLLYAQLEALRDVAETAKVLNESSAERAEIVAMTLGTKPIDIEMIARAKEAARQGAVVLVVQSTGTGVDATTRPVKPKSRTKVTKAQSSSLNGHS